MAEFRGLGFDFDETALLGLFFRGEDEGHARLHGSGVVFFFEVGGRGVGGGSFVVGAAVVCAFASEDASDDTADHYEPHECYTLQPQQEAEEAPSYFRVETHGLSAGVDERLVDMPQRLLAAVGGEAETAVGSAGG